ncbi:hypothetical protein VNI00_012808 [Paramarasmius palmivorus]|uniref:Uncharacterized protein n=1 Tax=Paramarasmius palmivorus TaxID=297713 RepID=A0AAW0C506_9AGAR
MAYRNPLHTSVGAHQKSNFSSLGSAVTNPSQSRRVPQSRYTPSGKKAQVGGSHPLQQPVAFEYIGYPNHGMPLREICVRGPYAMAQMMQGANDQVFAHTQLRKISLHIRWPGYERVEWIRSIDVIASSGPITRAQLAHAIAQSFTQYIEKVQYEATTSNEWRLGPANILLEHIVLELFTKCLRRCLASRRQRRLPLKSSSHSFWFPVIHTDFSS